MTTEVQETAPEPSTEPIPPPDWPYQGECVYVILVAPDIIKIGLADPLPARLKQLFGAIPFPAELLAYKVSPNARLIEKDLHTYFITHRVAGVPNTEFYWLDPPIKAFLDELRADLGLGPWDGRHALPERSQLRAPPPNAAALIDALSDRQRALALPLLLTNRFRCDDRKWLRKRLDVWLADPTQTPFPFTDDELRKWLGAIEATIVEESKTLRKRLEGLATPPWRRTTGDVEQATKDFLPAALQAVLDKPHASLTDLAQALSDDFGLKQVPKVKGEILVGKDARDTLRKIPGNVVGVALQDGILVLLDGAGRNVGVPQEALREGYDPDAPFDLGALRRFASGIHQRQKKAGVHRDTAMARAQWHQTELETLARRIADHCGAVYSPRMRRPREYATSLEGRLNTNPMGVYVFHGHTIVLELGLGSSIGVPATALVKHPSDTHLDPELVENIMGQVVSQCPSSPQEEPEVGPQAEKLDSVEVGVDILIPESAFRSVKPTQSVKPKGKRRWKTQTTPEEGADTRTPSGSQDHRQRPSAP